MLKKKILIVLTIMVMLVSMLPVNVIKAVETLQTNMYVYVYPNEDLDQYTVGAILNVPTDFAAANFELTYDKNALTFAEYGVGTSMKSGTNIVKNYPEEGKIKIAYMANPEEEDQTKTNTMYTFCFNRNEDFTGQTKCEFKTSNMKRRDGASYADNTYASYFSIVALLKSISLDKTTLSLTEGATDKLNVIYNPENAVVYEPTVWTSSNESVATVDDSGNVTAVSEGVATITATIGTDKSASCTATVSKAEVLLDSISLNKSEEELVVGQTDTLNIKYNPENVTEEVSVSWSSSNEEVATVDNGIVTALKAGTTTITANANGKLASCVYTVKDIELESIALSDVSAVIEKGTTKDLSVIYNPENTTVDKTVTWTTTDDTIASVDGNGVVTAKANGTATITATVNGKTATCDVIVKTTLESIALSDSTLTLVKGDSKTITATINPTDATVTGSMTWTSSDESVAIVSNGEITAINPGNAIITASIDGKSTSCKIKVLAPIESIALNKSETTIIKNEDEVLEFTVEPSNTTDDINATWTSADETIAMVDSNGKVKGVGTGSTTITVKVGDKTSTCMVTVKDIELESIKLNKEITNINKGKSETLVVTYNPENATVDKTITWTSSNEDVATVKDGIVTAKSKGTSLIVAKVGERIATCTVNVLVPLESISLDKTDLSIAKGTTEELTVIYNPDDTTDDKNVEWSSLDESIATVSNGIITPIGKGTTTISAKVGEKVATCNVSVVIPLESISISKATTTIIKNQEEKLEVIYNPDNTTEDKTVEWSSLNTRIATVVDGVVTGRKAGTVTIVAAVGDKVATCDVIVEEIELEKIMLNLSESEIKKGHSLQMEIEYIPENTTVDKNVIWKSSDENVAVVDENGIVTAIQAGETIITAMVDGKSATCKITVPEVHLENAYIVYELVEISIGDMIQMYIETEPNFEEITDDITTVWMSEDESIATVDENGVITGVGIGQTRVSVIVNDTIESYVTVIVDEAPVEEINTINTEVVPATGDIAVITISIIAVLSVCGIVFVIIKNKKK